MEENIPILLYSEVSVPRRRIVRSDAALYLLLLLGAIGCIVLSHLLASKFSVLRLVFQLALYAVLFVGGYLIYRLLLVSYRYTLTDAELEVRQLAGKKETVLVTVPLAAITSVGAWQKGLGAFDGRTYVGRRKDTLCLTYQTAQGQRVLCLSADERLKECLTEQLHEQRGTVTAH